MTTSTVEDLFLQNQEREQALRNLLKTRPSESRDVQGLRGEIRTGYSEILAIDPEFCAAKDVELLLWKNCYYKRIEDFRKRLRKYAHLAASLERAKAYEAREHLHGICQAFARFLGEATEFYSSLLRRFEAMQHQYAKGGGGAGGGGQGVGGNERRTRLLKLVVLSINRCFIFLGDLARYRELHGENSVKDWSSAERFYHQALAVLPTSGNPHNQLAVLATYTDAECVSVYRYCRSLMIESPFQTAHENLTLLFEKNKQKGFGMPVVGVDGGGKDGLGPGGSGSSRELVGSSGGGGGGTQHHSKGKGKGSGGRGNTGALLKSFLRRFVRLHGMVFSGRAEDLEDFPSIFETAIADFRTLLSNSAFGDALLLKMVVICIFSVTHVADASTAAAAAAAASATGSSASDPRDDSFSNSGSAADGGGSSIDGVSNSGSTGTQAGAADAAASMASKAEEVRRNARLSYPLALAFGVSAQIGRHVRTQEPTHPSQGSQHGGGGGGHGRGGHHRNGSHGGSHGGNEGGMLHGSHGHHGHHHHQQQQQQQHPPAPVVVYGVDSKSRPSSNQPQPRPLGSRLLGPVVLFCDWLTARSQFLCLAEEERSVSGGVASGRGAGVVRKAYASVAVQEAEMRGQFWEVVQRLAATLPDQDPTNQADAFPGDPLGRRRPLKEHVELRGFLPLADLYKKRYAMDGPAVPAVPDDCAGSVRIRGLKAFAAAVSGEPLATLSDLRYEEDLAGMGGHHRDRSEYSGRSESSTTSSGRIMHDGRPFEIALRQQGPSSQHSRAPPGMGSASGSATGSLLSAGGGGGGERGNRSLSGPGPVGTGYFGSGGSIGGGSDGEGWRSSKGGGLGAPGARQHTRNASVGTFRVPGGGHQHLHPQVSVSQHNRQHSQPMMPAFGGGGGGGDMDPSGGHAFHPPLHRVHSQATGVAVGSAAAAAATAAVAAAAAGGGIPGGSGPSARMYHSRHSDAASVSGSRHSLDSGMRYHEGRHAQPAGAPGGYNPTATGGVHSIMSNHGSGSGSSGPGSAHGSAHDTHSFGAWSAPGGRSGGGVGSGGGGGGGWAAENDRGSSFRSDPGSGDEEEVAVFTPGFGAPSRRRSTGGGGGPVVVGRRRDSAVGGSGRGEEGGGGGGLGGGAGGGGGGGSDLGSAGSPNFGSGRSGSGLLGGGIWTGAFHPQPHDLALSPQAPSDHNEDGERLGSEHSLFGAGSWRGAIGSGGGAGGSGGGGGGGNARTPGGTPVTGPLDASVETGLPSPAPSSPAVALADIPRNAAAAAAGGGGNGTLLESSGDGSQQQQQQQQDGNRPSSFDHRASADGGGIGYLNNPFQASRKQQQQQQQQQQQAYSASSSLRGQPSTSSMHSSRSPPSKTFDHHNTFEAPPGAFSTSAVPGPPNAPAPRSGSVGGGGGGGFQRDGSSPGQTADHQQQGRFSLPGPRQHLAAPGYPAHAQGPQAQQQQQQQRQAPGQSSPPLQPRQRHEQQLYGRRASSPGGSSRGGGGGGGGIRGDGDYSSGGSPVTSGAPNRSPPSTLPLAFSAGVGGGGGSSSLANNPDDASSIFSSNVSGHSTYSGFSGLSSINAFGGSELSSVAGAAAAVAGGGGGGGSANVISASLPWRTPPLGSQKGDLSAAVAVAAAVAGDDSASHARREGGPTPAYAAAHGSTGGALGWGTMMGTGSGSASGGGDGGGGGRRGSQG